MSSGSPMPSGRYLFINKRTEDVGKKDSDEEFSIRSHVHGEHRRQRNRARNRLLKQSIYGKGGTQTRATVSDPVTRPELPTQADLRPSVHPANHPKQPASTSSWRAGPAPAPRYEFQVGTIEPSKDTKSLEVSQIQVPGTSPSSQWATGARHDRSSQNHPPGPSSPLSGSSDPFSAAALPITALKHGLISFWEHRFVRAVCPSGENQIWLERTKVMWLEEIRGALSVKSRLHGLFAGALIFLLQGMGPSQEKRQLASLAVQHKMSCLSSLRDDMTQPGLRLQVLKAMYIAATMHFFAGEILESDLHAKAIAALVKQVGGLRRLDRILTFQLVILDTNLAYVLLQRPRLATPDWEPGPWSEQPFAGFSHALASSSPASHVDMCVSLDDPYHPDVPTVLQSHLQHHRETLYGNHMAQRLGQINSTSRPSTQAATKLSEDIQGWVRVRRFALSSQCMSLYFDIAQQVSDQRDATTQSRMAIDLQQCLCLAMEYCKRIIFLNSWEQVNIEIQFNHLRHPLARILDRMTDAGKLEYVEVLFFLFFVGAVGEELGLMGPAETTSTAANLSTRWFSRHMAVIAVRLGDLEFEEAKARLQQFLYDACTLDLPLKALLARRAVLLQDAPRLP
ncbi:hypothetical protein LTR10_012597 [Elasticomyces elasticus]|uniref:Transcription factor domain-containing protein n=1 Tax=Exophiala sideris TaxID=1016849 RepID=A0ABR0JSC5_9EURO|nr:hypothetical protein LTR10_012597 [Elasticomyces elasticus]KAK5040202.1 hypothetical protein LTS07_000699 [Exophiala sideris]KAK5043372.1 hypothetical protein LTR13_001143 [Exophiala sideris]KAK5068580.1 hypothetical protein LTR69_000700 [Exophiala sideris]KAK5186178.1 hypothetical protein LTR44_001233 [Eurotiomycetes sp. CCFEE 6388]